MINYAVILSAGLGTRFLPYTKAVPKPMLPIIDTPALEFIIKEAQESGIKNIIVVVGHNGDTIKKHFSKTTHLDLAKLSGEILEKLQFSENVDLQFTTQNLLNGTAGAILSARDLIEKNDFLVMNADELFIKKHPFDKPASKQLIEVFERTGYNIVGSQRVSKEDASRLGVIEGKRIDEKTIKLSKILEKPNIYDIKDPVVNLGRYVVKNDIFGYLENVQANKNGEFALTDALVNYAQNEPVLCYDFLATRYDLGNKLSFMKANFDLSLTDKYYGKEFQEYIMGKMKNIEN